MKKLKMLGLTACMIGAIASSAYAAMDNNSQMQMNDQGSYKGQSMESRETMMRHGHGQAVDFGVVSNHRVWQHIPNNVPLRSMAVCWAPGLMGGSIEIGLPNKTLKLSKNYPVVRFLTPREGRFSTLYTPGRYAMLKERLESKRGEMMMNQPRLICRFLTREDMREMHMHMMHMQETRGNIGATRSNPNNATNNNGEGM